MVKRIIYSHRARLDRKEILKYWEIRNGSKDYSRKLFRLFQTAVNLIAQHPEIGLQTEQPEVRSKVVRDYQIFYKVTDTEIQILAIWDCRQNSHNLTFQA